MNRQRFKIPICQYLKHNYGQAKGENEMIKWINEPLTEYIKDQSAKQYNDHANRENIESITQNISYLRCKKPLNEIWNVQSNKVINGVI